MRAIWIGFFCCQVGLQAQTAEQWFIKGLHTDSLNLQLAYFTKAIEHKFSPIDYPYATRARAKFDLTEAGMKQLDYSLSKYEAALADWDTAIALTTDRNRLYTYYLLRHRLKVRMERWQAAKEDLDTAITIHPNERGAYIFRGWLKAQMNDGKAALLDYDTAIAKSTSQLDASVLSEAYYFKGLVKITGADYVKTKENPHPSKADVCKVALADFDAAIKIKPDYAEVYIQRAITKCGCDDAPGALLDFNKVTELKLEPKFLPMIHMYRGMTYAQLRKYAAAILDLDKAIELNMPGALAYAYHYRGLAKSNLGAYKEAISDFDTAIQLKPTLVESYDRRCKLYYVLGDLEQASDDFEQVKALNGNGQDIDYPTWANYTFKLKDTTQPIITILEPKSNSRNVSVVNSSVEQIGVGKLQITIRGTVRDDTRIQTFSINGTPLKLNERDTFSVVVQLEEGENNFAFKATNASGKTTEKVLTIHHATTESPLTAPTVAGKRFALIIGNANYKMDPLKNPINDANLMDSTLKKLGFIVYKKLDGTKKEIETAIHQFGNNLTLDAAVVVFYAGHGMEVGQKNYLIPVDARLRKPTDAEKQCVAIDTIIQTLKKARTPHNLLILDACRDNPFLKKQALQGKSIGLINSDNDMLVFYATTPGQLAQDRSNRNNGLFTSCLVPNLDSAGLDLNTILTRTKAAVSAQSAGIQKPYLEGIPFHFIFKPSNELDAQQKQLEKVKRAASNTVLFERQIAKDATLALRMMLYNAQRHPDNEHTQNALHQHMTNPQNSFASSILEGLEGTVQDICFSPDGKKILAAGARNEKAFLWDIETRKIEKIFKTNQPSYPINAVAFSPDGQKIATGGSFLLLWDVQSKQIEKTFIGEHEIILTIRFSADGKKILTGGEGFIAKMWDRATQKIEKTFVGHRDRIMQVAFAPDGKKIVTCSLDSTAILWDIETQKAVKIFKGHQGGLSAAEFSVDGKKIWTSSADGTVRLWNLETQQTENVFKAHSDGVRTMGFSADRNLFVTGGLDGTIKLWNAITWRVEKEFSNLELVKAIAIAMAPDGSKIAVGRSGVNMADYTVKLWDVKPFKIDMKFALTEKLHSMAFAPNAKSLLTNSNSKFQLWDMETQKLKKEWDDTFYRFFKVDAIAFSMDGQQMLVGNEEHKVGLWNIASQTIEKTFTTTCATSAVAMAPNGKKILIGSNNSDGNLVKTVTLWDTKTQTIEKTFSWDVNTSILAVAFSPNGKKILVAVDNKIELRDIETQQLEHTFMGHVSNVTAICFSPNGKKLLTGSLDKTTKLWDFETQKLEKNFVGYAGAIKAVAFATDSNHLLTGYEDGSVKIWNIETDCIEHQTHSYSLQQLRAKGLQLELEDLLLLWQEGVKLSKKELQLIGKQQNIKQD